MSNGCGSAGRVVASDTQGLRFKYSRPRILMKKFFLEIFEKTRTKKNRARMPHYKNVNDSN